MAKSETPPTPPSATPTPPSATPSLPVHRGVRWREILRDDPKVTGSTLLVGFVISTFVDGETGQTILGANRLAGITGLSTRSVRRAMLALEELGLLERKRRWDDTSVLIVHVTKASRLRAQAFRKPLKSR